MDEIFKLIEKKRRQEILFMARQVKTFEALTEKRVAMVKVITEKQPTSIRELATMLERDVKNVFDDLRILNRMRIISFERKGRCVKPVAKKRFIIINLG